MATNWKNLEKLLKPGYKYALWKTWKKHGILKKSWKSLENIFEAKYVCKILERFWGKNRGISMTNIFVPEIIVN